MPSSQFNILATYSEYSGITGSQQVQLLDANTDRAIATITAQGASNMGDVVGGEAILQIAASLIKAIQDPALNFEQAMSDLKTQYSLRKVAIAPFTHDTENQAMTVSLIYQDRYYTIATVPGTDWVAVASMDLSEIRAAGKELIVVFALTALVLGVVAVGIILLLARQLSTPLGNLASTAEEVASGNLNVFAQKSGTSETQTLAQSFNNLIVQVKALLSKQAAETNRTQLLAEIARARSSGELESALNNLLSEVRATMSASRMVIYRFYPDGRGYIAAEAVLNEWPSTLGDKIEDPCIENELLSASVDHKVTK
ncbi:MAG: HAMP domain-containing protein [Xenococcaceae cyanobacterium]